MTCFSPLLNLDYACFHVMVDSVGHTWGFHSEAPQDGAGAGAAGGGLPAGAVGGQAPPPGLCFGPGQDQQVNKVYYIAALCSELHTIIFIQSRQACDSQHIR